MTQSSFAPKRDAGMEKDWLWISRLLDTGTAVPLRELASLNVSPGLKARGRMKKSTLPLALLVVWKYRRNSTLLVPSQSAGRGTMTYAPLAKFDCQRSPVTTWVMRSEERRVGKECRSRW